MTKEDNTLIKLEMLHKGLTEFQEILNSMKPSDIDSILDYSRFDFYRLTNNVFMAKGHLEQIMNSPIKKLD
jgi:hypothetical protein